MPNRLDIGMRRQGTLIDFDPSTAHVNVTLERFQEAIELTISWADEQSPHAAWFLPPTWYSSDVVPGVPVPSRLMFQDSYGTVLLIGCHRAGHHSTMDGPGTGRIRAQCAVLGVSEDLNYQTLNGLRSEVPGLRSWLGLSSVQQDVPQLRNSELVFTLEAQAAQALELPQHPALRFIPVWNVEQGEDSVTVRDRVLIETRSEEGASWPDLLSQHHAVRDLMVISQWREEPCVPTAAMRNDDPITTLDGKTHGDLWRELVYPAPAPVRPHGGRRDHLIKYTDIGSDGVSEWLSIHEDFGRALDPVISSRALGRATPMTLLAQVGPGAEALGYLLLLRDGAGRATARASSLRERLQRVALDVKGCVPFDAEEWAFGAAQVYNSLKHANRTAPEEVDVLNRWRQTVLAIRVWVAVELGVERQALAWRAANDQLAQPFGLVD